MPNNLCNQPRPFVSALNHLKEVQTNDGRIDAVIETDDHIYLFEFKLDKTAQEAVTQIQAHKYHQKYQLKSKKVICVGANFNGEKRTVDEWLIVDTTEGVSEER